ncbi:MAG: response regulator transcription factor [Planctomycetes bacterium]|nr:response regulator transcription factor [Planctomycetota bacterium]
MKNPKPPLSQTALTRLRGLVGSLHKKNGQAVPMKQLVALARDVEVDGALTIDLDASRDLGHPMVVVRVPEHSSAPSLEGLSKREREVALLMANGLSNKQIARKLFIALATVKDHVHRILKKTSLPNRAAVAAAVSIKR